MGGSGRVVFAWRFLSTLSARLWQDFTSASWSKARPDPDPVAVLVGVPQLEMRKKFLGEDFWFKKMHMFNETQANILKDADGSASKAVRTLHI